MINTRYKKLNYIIVFCCLLILCVLNLNSRPEHLVGKIVKHNSVANNNVVDDKRGSKSSIGVSRQKKAQETPVVSSSSSTPQLGIGSVDDKSVIATTDVARKSRSNSFLSPSPSKSSTVLTARDSSPSSSSSSVKPASSSSPLAKKSNSGSVRHRERPFSQTLPPIPPDNVTGLPLKPMEDVTVAVMTSHFFGGDFSGMQKDCKLGSTVINCNYVSSTGASSADGLWYHVPSFGGSSTNRHHSKQLRIAMSMESDQYYSTLREKRFMENFDIESSYRTCSQAPVFYFDYNRNTVDQLFREPEPLSSKVPAIAYINSNCGARSGRSTIMAKLIEIGAGGGRNVPVHSYGSCNRNMDKRITDKIGAIHKYKFCVAMENSITKDYITEKLWQALEAGCVPIYYGPPNVAEQLPDPNAIIDYSKLGSPEALMEEIIRLNEDDEAYEAKLAWKYKDYDELSESMRSFMLRSHVFKPHSRCQICQVLLRHRYQPKASYGTCIFNSTWTATHWNS